MKNINSKILYQVVFTILKIIGKKKTERHDHYQFKFLGVQLKHWDDNQWMKVPEGQREEYRTDIGGYNFVKCQWIEIDLCQRLFVQIVNI